MNTRNRRAVIVLMCVSFVTGAAAQQTAGFNPADTKELASYRLTMESVKRWHAVARAMFDEAKKDPKFQALAKTKAEIKALQAKEERTEAEESKLESLQQQKEQQEQALDGADEINWNTAKTIDEMEAGIKKFPPAMRALAEGGMSPREFSKHTLAVMMASMVAMFQKSGAIDKLPPDLKMVNPENVKFVVEHEAELMALQQELAKLDKGGN